MLFSIRMQYLIDAFISISESAIKSCDGSEAMVAGLGYQSLAFAQGFSIFFLFMGQQTKISF